MIKNGKQAAITKESLANFINAKNEYLDSNPDVNSIEHQFQIDSLDGVIDDLQSQLDRYNYLKKGNFHCFKGMQEEDLPEILISARIAQDITHQALAEKLGITAQQVQRYEATNFDSANRIRILEFCEALNLKLFYESVIIIGKGPTFNLPSGIDEHIINSAELTSKYNGSLII